MLMSILSTVCAVGQMIYDILAVSNSASEFYCNDYYDYYHYSRRDFCENVSLEEILETVVTAFERT